MRNARLGYLWSRQLCRVLCLLRCIPPHALQISELDWAGSLAVGSPAISKPHSTFARGWIPTALATSTAVTLARVFLCCRHVVRTTPCRLQNELHIFTLDRNRPQTSVSDHRISFSETLHYPRHANFKLPLENHFISGGEILGVEFKASQAHPSPAQPCSSPDQRCSSSSPLAAQLQLPAQPNPTKPGSARLSMNLLCKVVCFHDHDQTSLTTTPPWFSLVRFQSLSRNPR